MIRLKHILKSSNKKRKVDYKNKDNRTSFDESFGLRKIKFVKKLINNNSLDIDLSDLKIDENEI